MSQQNPGEDAARLAAIVSSSDDAIVSKTLDGIVTSWNASAERMFGYTADEMIGQPITKIIPTELLGEEAHIISQLRKGVRVEHFETVRLAKNGDMLDLSITVSPIRDTDGRIIGASKVARDIRERKHAQKVQRLLIDELNHRIKNTLATVQAIAFQTLRHTPDPKAFVGSFNGRIQALARAHGLLTGNSFQSAEIHDIVREQFAMEGFDRSRLQSSGPTLRLHSQPALHLSLVLHELGVNARKHGALADPAGKVDLRWSVGRDASPIIMTLVWSEQTTTPISPPTSRGFGTTLIEQSLLAHGSEVSMDYRPTGLVCTIVLPLPAVSAEAEAFAPVADRARWHEPYVGLLQGRRVLVVEDEPLIAMKLVDDLLDLGCEVVGPAHSVTQARALLDREQIDAALLDGNLSGSRVDDVATQLAVKKAPFAFVTGYGREALPVGFQHARIVEKPFTREQIGEALNDLLAPGAAPFERRD